MTEAQLNSKNKGQVVTIALNLSERLEAYENGPLSSSQVVAKMLQLKKEALAVKEAAAQNKREHTERMAQIEADKVKSIKEMELKYASDNGKDAEELKALYEELEKNVAKAKGDLTFGLEEAENDANAKLEKISDKVDKATAEADIKLAELASKLQEAKSKNAEELASMKISHERKLEQENYDMTKSRRDAHTEELNEYAKEHDLVLVTKSAHDTATKGIEKQLEEADKANAIAIAEAVKAEKASSAIALNSLKVNKDNEIALLKNDVSHKDATIVSNESRIKDLESRLSEVPGQIKDAVEAAKSAVTVHQDAAKK